MQRSRAVMAMASVLCAVALAGARAGGAQGRQALAKLAVEDGFLAWDGVRVGLSLVAAERKVGTTLALTRNPETMPCAKFVAIADRGGLTLTLGFASPKPSAKIEWLRVRFEGDQIAASSSELVAELKARFPEAEWRRAADAPPDLPEADDLAPVYTLPGKAPQAVRLVPREAVELSTPDCFGG